MIKFRNILLTIIALSLASKAFCATAWINDLKTLFVTNHAIIYAINIRTFNARDYNQNGIIEENLGEEKGTFINAADRLDEIHASGVNTILLMPVTTTGKVKALGTAGSLYAPVSFDEINPQLKSPNSKLSVKTEMIKFIDECHKRNIRVMVDLPACGAYDLYLTNPELFVKDKNNNPVVPADWTDVRLLNAGDNEHINMDVYNLYMSFIDLMQEMDIDGIRADVASIKPYAFWKKLIGETRMRNPEFLFLAEASDSQKSPSEYAVNTSCNKLLEAGFDGYYGNYGEFKNWDSASSLYNNVKSSIELQKKYSNKKSVLGAFATHDQVSPILINGTQYSKMIIWLNATLPINSYFIDGFSTGDTYIYQLMNKKATKTYTDDEYYFVHRGQMDIFNFSRFCIGNNLSVFKDFAIANKFKNLESETIAKGDFIPLKTSNSSVFGYERRYGDKAIIIIGNLDFQKGFEATINTPGITSQLPSIPIKLGNIPKIYKNKIKTALEPGEINVLMFTLPKGK